jgi:transcriptional regulator with XRE-family HTH domain
LRQIRRSFDFTGLRLACDDSRRIPRLQTAVKTNRLDNYLRSYRKKSGLTQSEVGFLLGRSNGAQISRYEKRRRLPPLEIALALEALLGVPVSQLFAGIHDSANADIRKRIVGLRSVLQTKSVNGSEALITAQKLRWLTARQHAEVSHHATL